MRCTFYSSLAFAAILAKEITAIAAEEESLANIDNNRALAQLEDEESWLETLAQTDAETGALALSSSSSSDSTSSTSSNDSSSSEDSSSGDSGSDKKKKNKSKKDKKKKKKSKSKGKGKKKDKKKDKKTKKTKKGKKEKKQESCHTVAKKAVAKKFGKSKAQVGAESLSESVQHDLAQ